MKATVEWPALDNGALASRARIFVSRLLRLCHGWPDTEQARVLCRRLLDSGAGVGMHLRRVSRQASPDHWNKALQASLQDLDETRYWMELSIEAGLGDRDRITALMEEAGRLARLFESNLRQEKTGRRERGPYLIYVG